MANQEAFTLDGLALNDQTTFAVDSVSWPPPRQRQDWIGGADSETQLLFRKPKHENRKVTLRVAVIPQATMDLALAKVAQVVDKLEKAGQYTDGIGLVWTPATATLSCTFDVLAGEITDLPIDWENGWLALAPTFTIELTCKPYARGARVVYGTTTTNSTPFQVLELPSIPGDIAALGELIVTDNATQSRRHVEWGLEGPLTYNNATSLLVDSDDMITTGFSGAQAATTGAYDPNATGNNSITATLLGGTTTAIAGTANLSHVGVFRVKARVQANSLATLFRLSWKAGDGPMNHNPWVTPIIDNVAWQELDLGTITVPAAVLGAQRWVGQIDVLADPAASNPTAALDYLILVPQADGYGVSRAVFSPSTGLVVAADSFTATTAGGALGGRTAPLGGAWATSGDATDFVFDDQFKPDVIESIIRSTTAAETTGRFAILGTTNYTDMQVDVRALVGGSTEKPFQDAIVRWTDSSNYVRLTVPSGPSPNFVKIDQVVAGAVTNLAQILWTRDSNTPYRFRLIAFASGRVLGYVLSDAGVPLVSLGGSSSAVATGGALASGKPGLRDRHASGIAAVDRRFTGFTTTVPAAEPIAIYSTRTLQFRYDDTLRDDAAATYAGRPPSYRGSRFLVPVGTSRVLVKARRNDVGSAADDQVTDSTKIQVAYQPRYLAVPR